MEKLINRETVSYVIFGAGTTAVDWLSYGVLRYLEINYMWATVGAWAAAVLFAFITNKLFVFQSYGFQMEQLKREFFPFVVCRISTGLISLAVMFILVDGLRIEHDFFCKVLVSVLTLVLNYILSKWFIFKNQK